ncbi:MAG TPA: type II secretion system protein GspK [Myxococcota bacterium]|nr:type II secretion system protein GspK [Myxococcota bacterium]HRY94828.1 type II secretion system protein GspK [Myxococcota bacterium]HSA21755.1 type II secretion system protein GspK [Myxococcota bacterium]
MSTRRTHPRHGERGMALLMVLVTIAMLTVAVVEFLHQSRVELQTAANVRDRAKAYYLARSAANFSRLILYFQGQADRMSGGTLKLYQLIPIESDLTKAFTSGELGDAFGLKAEGLEKKRGFGQFDGSFSATIEDEYAKINLNSLDSIASIASPAVAQLVSLIAAPRYKPMWEAEDAEGQTHTPADVVMAIHDWIDVDNTADAFNPEAVVADPFSQSGVFVPGTGDEDSRYDMLRSPYKNKNNPLLTVDELHNVRGVGDDFMDEFGSHFTVYSDPNLLLNLSSVNDPMMMLAVLCMQPENMALCTEQGLPQLLEVLALFFEFRNLMQMSTFSVPNAQAIAGFFSGQGATLSPYFLKNLAPFSDTFSIQAEGSVGEVRVVLRAVVKNTNSGQEIMYWRVM